MATTKATDLISLPDLADAIPAAFAARNALLLESLGAATIVSGLANLTSKVAAGVKVQVPYFSAVPDFQDLAENQTMVVQSVGETYEEATIERWGNAIGITDLASKVTNGAINTEAARQLVATGMRKLDDKLLAKAIAPGAITTGSVWSSSTPVNISYDAFVDLETAFDDAGDSIVAYLMHPKAFADALKLKGTDNRPLLTSVDGQLPNLFGKPIIKSNKMTSGGAMGSATATGTTPPAATLAGTPNGMVKSLKIECVLAGAHGTAKFRFSTDNGATWSDPILTTSPASPIALTDTAVDSLVGKNGATGLTVAFAAGTFATDNKWSATSFRKLITAAVRRNALVAVIDLHSLASPEINRRPLDGSEDLVSNFYGAAIRYRRTNGQSMTGVALLEHN